MINEVFDNFWKRKNNVEDIAKDTKRVIFYFLAYCLFIIIGTLLDGHIPLTALSAAKYTVYVVLFATGVVLLRQTISNSWKLLKSRVIRNLLLLAGLYIVYVLLSAFSYYLLGPNMGASGINAQKVYQVMTSLPPYITLPVLGVMGPVVEEFIYRHLLINRLSARFGTWQCVLLSSILFGLLHVHGINDLVNVLPYVIMGLVLGTLYVKSGYNLLLPIIFHVFNNLNGLAPIAFS